MGPARIFGATAGRAFMAAAAKIAARKAAPAGEVAAKKTTTSTSRPTNTGIQKVVPVSSELGNFLGTPQVSRTDAIKRVWEYIKLQNLQNPSNKEIFCDAKLKTIFYGKDKIEMRSLGRRSMSTVAKAVEEITGTGNTKIRKAQSELCTFLDIPRHSRSEIATILSKFIKLYNSKSPGIKKDKIWEQNLQTLLRGRNSVGFPEIAKILSPEFGQGAINVKDSNMDSSMDGAKGKGSQKKGKSSKK